MKKSYLFILTLFAAYSFAQTNILQQFHNESSLVIEGKIIGSSSYFDSNGDIFTDYEVQTSQLLKGNSNSIVILKALGGIVDGHFQVVSHQLKFKLNDEGIFFLNKNISSNTYKMKYHERFINYRKLNNEEIKAANEALLELYPEFTTILSKSRDDRNLKTTNFPNIESISPLEISAGTNSELTINGSGFGIEKGTVGFRNANDGGASFIFTYSEIIEWTDEKIVVEVPDLAGSGGVKIKKADNYSIDSAFAGFSLVIPYSQFTIKTTTFGDSITVPLRHIGAMPNGTDPSDHLSGGNYKFKMNSEFFDNIDAKTMFLQGLSEWSCKTGVNFVDAGLLTSSDTESTINLVRFADFDANGYGGAAFTSLKGIYGCGTNEANYVGIVTNIDFVYDSNINWGYDIVSNNQFDFEWTTAHEIGHASLFLHVIDQNNLMHYAGSYGDLNYGGLNQTYIDAGKEKVSFSASPFICGLEMSVSECFQTLSLSQYNYNAIRIKLSGSSIYVNTPESLDIEKISLFDISGRIVKNINMKVPSNHHRFDIENTSSQIYFIQLLLSDNTSHLRKIIL
jgi:hypothetical protein